MLKEKKVRYHQEKVSRGQPISRYDRHYRWCIIARDRITATATAIEHCPVVQAGVQPNCVQTEALMNTDKQ